MKTGVIVDLVLPGQVLSTIIEETLEERASLKSKRLAIEESASAVQQLSVKLGHGLLQVNEDIVANRGGSLVFEAPNKFYILGPQKRYIPAVGDLVIGIVVAKLAELYRVDIGCHMVASLPLSGFEGITKKNKPNIGVGSVVFARVLVANKDVEPELVCLDVEGKGGEGFGEVKEGEAVQLTRCSVTYSRALQRASCPILEALGKHLAFEIVVGANGKFVVIGAGGMRETLLISRAIMEAEGVPPTELSGIIRRTMEQLNSAIKINN